MLTLVSLALAAATASAPIQVQSTPARESSNKAAGFGKHLDQSALASKVSSVSTASFRPDGTIELSCETHRPNNHELESHELARNEQEK